MAFIFCSERKDGVQMVKVRHAALKDEIYGTAAEIETVNTALIAVGSIFKVVETVDNVKKISKVYEWCGTDLGWAEQ